MAKRKRKAKKRRVSRVRKAPKRRRSMARRKRRGRKKDKAIPLGVAVPAIWVGYERVYVPLKDKNYDGLKQMWTGIAPDGTFTSVSLVKTYGPLLVGTMASKVASRLGLNRKIKQMSMGWLKI